MGKACSFCGAKDTVVARLVAGPGVYICGGCIDLARQVIAAAEAVSGPPQGAEIALSCSFCGHSAAEVERLVAGPGVYICGSCVDLCVEIVTA